MVASCTNDTTKIDGFEADTTSIEALASGGEYSIVIRSDREWTAQADVPWLMVSPANGRGEVRCKGINKKGVAWRVGVETPFDGNQSNGEFIQQIISLSNCSMATSGNYRRYYLDKEGRKVAHTIDPRTGQSVISELLSATVIAPTCAEADAYGTMFMALGKEAAIELARRMSEQGVYVYFITSGKGDEFEVYYSSQLESKLSHSEGFNAL